MTVCQYLMNSEQLNKGLFRHEEQELKEQETSEALTAKALEGYGRF